MLRGWLQNRFANRIDVDDIVQESLLRVLKAKEVNDIKSVSYTHLTLPTICSV